VTANASLTPGIRIEDLVIGLKQLP